MKGDCDVCAGSGKPANPNKVCICGGTGNAIDAVHYLRKRVYDLEDRLEKTTFAIEGLAKRLDQEPGNRRTVAIWLGMVEDNKKALGCS